MASLVDLVVRLKDQASAGLGSISGRLGKLGGSGSVANASMRDLGGTIASSIIQANLLGAAFGAVGQGVSFVQGKIAEATNLQLDQLTATTTFSSLTGKSFDESAAFIDRLNNRLAKSAAALPGVTQDYKSLAIAIQDNVLEAFKGVDGQVDMTGFENTVAGISESYGALAAASNVPVSNLQLGLTKALGGASTAGLRQIQFFEQNGIILNEIDKRLGALGKKSLADLNIKDRVKLLEEVGKKFITEDFKREAGKSVDGLVQSFKSSLFDPSTGIFGLMRDLNPDTKGVQSAFSAYNDALIALIGPNGLFNTIAKTLDQAGIKLADPMEILRDGIVLFTSGVKGVSEFVAFVGRQMIAVRAGHIPIHEIPEILGNYVNHTILQVRSKIQKGIGIDLGIDYGLFEDGSERVFSRQGVDWNFISTGISSVFMRAGQSIHSGLQAAVPILVRVVNSAAAGISAFLGTFDFHGVGVATGVLLGVVGGKIVDVITQLNYADILVGIGRLAIGTVQLIAGAIGGMAIGIAPSIAGFFVRQSAIVAAGYDLFFAAVGQTLNDVFSPLINIVRTRFGEEAARIAGLVEFSVGAFNALTTGGISGFFSYLHNSATAFFDSIFAPIAPTFSNGVGGIIEMITGKINEFIGFLNQAIAGAMDQLRNIPGMDRILPATAPSIPTLGGAPPSVAPTMPAPLGFTMSTVPVVAGAVAAATPAVTPTAPGSLFSPSALTFGVRPMFEGTPNLANAIAAESRNMPTGADLVVANSSEVVLNRRQAAALSGGGKRGNNNFTFNISGANPQETWAFIKAQIEAEISGALT